MSPAAHNSALLLTSPGFIERALKSSAWGSRTCFRTAIGVSLLCAALLHWICRGGVRWEGSSRVPGHPQLCPLWFQHAGAALPLMALLLICPFAAAAAAQRSKTNKGTSNTALHHLHLPGSLHMAMHGVIPGSAGPGQTFTDPPVQVTSPCPQGQLSQVDPRRTQAATRFQWHRSPYNPPAHGGLCWQCHRTQAPLKTACHWLLDFSRYCDPGKNMAAIKGGSLLAGIL